MSILKGNGFEKVIDIPQDFDGTNIEEEYGIKNFLIITEGISEPVVIIKYLDGTEERRKMNISILNRSLFLKLK